MPTFGSPDLQNNPCWVALWRKHGSASMSSRLSRSSYHNPPPSWIETVTTWEKAHGIVCQLLDRHQFNILDVNADDQPGVKGLASVREVCFQDLSIVVV